MSGLSAARLAGAAVSDFYALPSVGITLDAFPAAVIGFTLNVGAFTSEVIRATLLSVAKGQWEAAHSIGMSWAIAALYYSAAGGEWRCRRCRTPLFP